MGVKERKIREFKRREEEILEKAYQLLTEMAPAQMTMEMIAEQVEIGRGTIYKHFKNKNEIYASLILRRRNKFIQRLRDILDEGIEHESGLIRTYMAYSLEDTVAFRVHQKCVNHCVRENLSPEISAALEAQQSEKIRLLEQILENRLQDIQGDRSDLIYYLSAAWSMQRGAIDALLRDNLEGAILDQDKYFKVVESMLLNGLPTVK